MWRISVSCIPLALVIMEVRINRGDFDMAKRNEERESNKKHIPLYIKSSRVPWLCSSSGTPSLSFFLCLFSS
jgi:hypothetical protein